MQRDSRCVYEVSGNETYLQPSGDVKMFLSDSPVSNLASTIDTTKLKEISQTTKVVKGQYVMIMNLANSTSLFRATIDEPPSTSTA